MVPAETQSSTVVANNNILGPVESRCRDMHKVKRKETVFSISREYGISEAELIAANPELKGENKIKKEPSSAFPIPKHRRSKISSRRQYLPTASCSVKTGKRQNASAPSRLPSSFPSWTGYQRASLPAWWNTTKAY